MVRITVRRPANDTASDKLVGSGVPYLNPPKPDPFESYIPTQDEIDTVRKELSKGGILGLGNSGIADEELMKEYQKAIKNRPNPVGVPSGGVILPTGKLSPAPQKPGWSTGAKVALGAACAAGAGLGILLATSD